ncbi:mitochondrial import inner membrane translocase subunit Tim8 B-like [Onychomys torridus]|uniref:mitochondrial import inner membrane translocase subunit Tim8 B-like n=1 Tax=Onychomys torridus TaxID=38674 RepID=UPI00167F2D3D|nr:mitochondrial import inner membrane translocase subunit Tim8 B-like [Onychomys torridus]
MVISTTLSRVQDIANLPVSQPIPTIAKLAEADEVEFQCLLATEQQKAQLLTEVHHIREPCWDECVENLENWLDSCTENCITSCVDCFTNTLAITGQFAQNVQKGGQ